MIRRRFPAGLLAAAVAFFLLIVIPFNQAYRAAGARPVMLSTRQAVAAAPAIAGQVLASDLSPSVLGQSANYLAQRIRTIDSPAIIMQRTPGQIPYSSPGELAVSPVIDLDPPDPVAGQADPGRGVPDEPGVLPAPARRCTPRPTSRRKVTCTGTAAGSC